MNLSEAERLVVECARDGRIANFENGEVLGGEFLAILAAEENPEWTVATTGVLIVGAIVKGTINLSSRKFAKPLRLRRCILEGGEGTAIYADEAEFEVLELSFCQANAAVVARHIRVARGLYISGTTIAGALDLRGAVINGPMLAYGAVIRGTNGMAVIADLAQFQTVIFDGLAMTGKMSMAEARIESALSLVDANIDNGRDVVLDLARLRTGRLILAGARVAGTLFMQSAQVGALLNAAGAVLKNPGQLVLEATHLCADCVMFDGISCEGEISLISARITNNISIARGRLTNPNSVALQGDLLQADMVQLNHATIAGEVRFAHARVSAQLDFHGMKLHAKNVLALCADEARIGSVILEDAVIDGGVRLRQIEIATSLRAAKLQVNNEGNVALNMEYGRADACLLSGARINGSVRLVGARINAHVALDEIVINSPGIEAVAGWNMRMTTLSLDDARIVGQIGLTNARIDEKLLAFGASIINPGKVALNLSGAVVNGPVSITGTGHISSERAVIEGGIALGYGSFYGPVVFKELVLRATPEASIDVSGSTIPGRFACMDVKASAALVLDGANITGHCELKDVSFARSQVSQSSVLGGTRRSQWPSAISIRDATIGCLTLPSEQQLGSVDLSRTAVRTLVDYSASWPPGAATDANFIVLSGLKYEYLEHPGGLCHIPEAIWRARLRWLRSQPPEHMTEHFDPHPWRQLSSVLAKQGYDEDAKQILIHERVYQAQAADVSKRARWLNLLLRSVGDFGFNPAKTVVWLFALWIGCAVIYSVALIYCETPSCVDGRIFVPVLIGDVVMDGIQEDISAGPSINDYPPFEPLSYSIDVLIPLLDLGAESYWRPNTQAGVIIGPYRDWVLLTWGGLLYVLVIVEEVLGSFLVAVAIAGFTGLLIPRRDGA